MEKRTRVGFVVPTLGTRIGYITECLKSLESEGVFIAVIGPDNLTQKANLSQADLVIDDQGLPLPEAINLGVKALPERIEYISWLGDDDLLLPGATDAQIEILDSDTRVVATYGKCQYIDAQGNDLIIQRSGQFAAHLLSWGPNLIPQPGGLFRRSAWDKLNGLESVFSQAFDTDLFLRMKKIGDVIYTGNILANYRWHDDALSVRNRWLSIKESSLARKRSAGRSILNSPIIDWPVRLATLAAGKLLSMRLKIIGSRK